MVWIQSCGPHEREVGFRQQVLRLKDLGLASDNQQTLRIRLQSIQPADPKCWTSVHTDIRTQGLDFNPYIQQTLRAGLQSIQPADPKGWT